jgi:hypothetical protein
MPLSVNNYATRRYLYRFFQPVQARTQGFAGGVNARDAPNQLAPNEVRKLENMLLDERGGASKRLGCQSQGGIGVGADRFLSTFTFYRQAVPAVQPQVIAHTTAGKVYYTNDPTANPVVWTQIATGLSTTEPMCFEAYNNMVFMSNGVDNYAHGMGPLTLTYASALPRGQFLKVWKDAMWVSGVPGLPDRVYTSNAGDATVFGVSAWVDIAKGDGDAITALGSDGLYLIPFKRRRHFNIYDPVTFANRVVDFEKGCESHFSVVAHEGSIYFLSRRGIARYLGDSPAEIISGKIDPIFDPSILNFNALNLAWAYVINNRVAWAVPEAGSLTPTMQIEYSPRLAASGQPGPFSFHRIPGRCFTTYRWQSYEHLYAGASGSNKLLWVFAPIGTDDGVAFSGILETMAFDLGSIAQEKYIRRMRVSWAAGDSTYWSRRTSSQRSLRLYPIDLSAANDLWSLGDAWSSG